MNSRLDRLFILLDTGSNDSIRLAAAKQLGEVQRVQPSDIDHLLRRIKEYSVKSVWETRVAAGQATRFVLEQVATWPPKCDEVNNLESKAFTAQQVSSEEVIGNGPDPQIVLKSFDVDQLMRLQPKLLSLNLADSADTDLVTPSSSRGQTKSKSQGKRCTRTKQSSSSFDKERLMRQRKLINKELGIVDSLNLGVNSNDIVSNDDLQADFDNGEQNLTKDPQQNPKEKISTMISNYDGVIKTLIENKLIPQSDLREESIDDEPNKFGSRWILATIIQDYIGDLFNSSWEVRHGAAIALREIVKTQGRSIGRLYGFSDKSNEKLNQLWLVDMALKALAVLTLDKFGDFLFDQVVAPVRENVAQLLGCCVAIMTRDTASTMIGLILRLLKSTEWETRHGGILALKYCLSIVDKNLTRELIKDCFEPIFKTLADQFDDVSAEAAASLVPVKDLIMETIPEAASTLIKFLWEHLVDLDDLTTSTSNIILLLASLITSSHTQLKPEDLTKSIPRLWSLMGHSSTAVRSSVLKALKTMLDLQEKTCLSWMPEGLISTALRLIFERSILENTEEVSAYLEQVWMQLVRISDDKSEAQEQRFKLLKIASQYLNYWLCLVMQPCNTPIDRNSPMWLNIGPDGKPTSTKPDGEVYIASCTFNAETMDQQKNQVTNCRLTGCRLLGALYANLVNEIGSGTESQHSRDTLNYLSDMFVHYMKTKSANLKIYASWALESWAHQQSLLLHDCTKVGSFLPKILADELNQSIREGSLCYDELASNFTRLQQEARDLVLNAVKADINVNVPTSHDKRLIYNMSQLQTLNDLDLDAEVQRISSKKLQSGSNRESDSEMRKDEIFTSLARKKANFTRTFNSTSDLQKNLSTCVLSSVACSLVAWKVIPEQIDLIIGPLLSHIEIAVDPILQEQSIRYLVKLVDILCLGDPHEHKSTIDKVLLRLFEMLNTKQSKKLSTEFDSDGRSLEKIGENIHAHRIILLDSLQRRDENNRFVARRQSSINNLSSLKRSHSLASSIEFENDPSNDDHASAQTSSELSATRLRGASLVLVELTKQFGEPLPEKLPRLWTSITSDIQSLVQASLHLEANQNNLMDDEKLVENLQLFVVVADALDEKLVKRLLTLFDDFVSMLRAPNPIVRHYSSQCIGVLSKLLLDEMSAPIKDKILPMLEENDNPTTRCGSIECIAFIIEHLHIRLVPMINQFIIHVLRRMSDQNEQVRLMAAHCFGKLLNLMPLNLGRKVHEKGSSAIKQEVDDEEENDKFVEKLLDPTKLEKFSLPYKMSEDLRTYQQDGLNWLAFLNRYNLQGILCDEMGLGKTFMTICMVASEHTKPIFQTSPNKDVDHDNKRPSLIVCPSTLTEHWLYEIDKFVPPNIKSILNPAIYSGTVNDRSILQHLITKTSCKIDEETTKSKIAQCKLLIASYDIVRNDNEFFKSIHWNYCVLDEGHIIKNSKSKISRAIRLLTSEHRLILSGTPIQNNVTELWSLFDFLMPGLLGSERQFNARFSRPILQSKEPKCSSREQEAGALAMESLHRQVLPFILRRLKEDVLDDLPPKIIQDYHCELSPVQHKLYDDFTRSRLCTDMTKKSIGIIATEDDSKNNDENRSESKRHVFQALQYLKNVCNHPKLVLTPKHSQYREVMKMLESEKSSLDDITHSSKLKALRQLLLDCGIGATNPLPPDDQQPSSQQNQSLAIEAVVNQHRALIFCQLRSMIEIIENDLLKKFLPNITYLRLDGSVPTNQRQSIVSRFNNDPSIDILLLTTQIGGLGLNLTGADTVIFVEHDWNPTRDLQAMDRAHRIGQRKVVNVYRLITKGTLEEKIMGSQKFKTMVSNTVINQDNASLGTMDVDQLFDLFDHNKSNHNEKTSQGQSSSRGARSSKGSDFVDLLPELWDQQQYETEYDLSNFVSSLKN